MTTDDRPPIQIEWCDVPGGDVEVVRTRYDNPAQETGLRIKHLHRQVAPFTISRRPVSVGQFQAFIDAPDGYFDRRWWNFSSRAMQARRPQPPSYADGDAQRPVDRVAWYDAIAFCRWLSVHLQMTISLPDEFRWQHAASLRGRIGLEGIGEIEEWCLFEGQEDILRDSLANRGAPWSTDPIHVRRELNPLAIEPHLGFRLLLVSKAAPTHNSGPASVDMDDIFLMMERVVNPRHPLAFRLQTVQQLGATGDRRAAEQLLEYLEKLLPSSSPGDAMPVAIVQALRGYDDATLAGPLIRAMKSRDPELRAAAALALADYNEPHVVQQLVIGLRDEVAAVREASSSALLRGNYATTIATIMRVWQTTPTITERLALIDVLLRFDHPDAVTALRLIARNDADAGLRARAAAHLSRHPHHANPDHDRAE